MVKFISTNLSKKIWTYILKLIKTKYIELFFLRQRMDIRSVELAHDLNFIEDNSNSMREFFEDLADFNAVKEANYDILFLIKYAKASTQRDIIDSIKLMVGRDVVNSDENLTNIIELKSD
jgi:hypothetical protein